MSQSFRQSHYFNNSIIQIQTSNNDDINLFINNKKINLIYDGTNEWSKPISIISSESILLEVSYSSNLCFNIISIDNKVSYDSNISIGQNPL